MKIGIIGAGNMGGAIIRGIAFQGKIAAKDMIVASPNRKGELDALKEEFPEINITQNNSEAAYADYTVIAVKPWLLDVVLKQISPVLLEHKTTIISIVAGITCSEISEMIDYTAKVVRVIPNTAIVVGESMNFITTDIAQLEAKKVEKLFAPLGKTMIIDEKDMQAACALSSCGIAYAFRYIRAASEGGVELGIPADKAKEIVMQTLKGAVALLEKTGNHPETEIDKVTTPGGITIKGLNAMERYGFTTSVIEGLKASK